MKVGGMRRSFLACLIALVLLAPAPWAAVAGGPPVDAVVSIVPGVETNVVLLHREQEVSSEAEATDTLGAPVVMTQSRLIVEVVGEEAFLDLPVALTVAQALNTFHDPDSGVWVSEQKIVIPVKDDKGVEVMAVHADVKVITSVDDSARVVGTNVVLKSKELSVDLGDGEKVSASFEVQLKELPQGASARVSVSQQPTKDVRNSFDAAVALRREVVASVAVVLDVKKTMLANVDQLGEAVVTMIAAADWAERYGLNRVKIMRYGDDGSSQVLETRFLMMRDGEAIFEADSPDGLSTFALTAIVPMRSPFNWLLLAAGVGGGGVVLGSLFVLLARRGRKRQSALRRKWATGLSPEDWRR